jgi:hypothetical protein
MNKRHGRNYVYNITMKLNEMDFGVVILTRLTKGPDPRVNFCVSDSAPAASDTT